MYSVGPDSSTQPGFQRMPSTSSPTDIEYAPANRIRMSKLGIASPPSILSRRAPLRERATFVETLDYDSAEIT